MTSTELFVGLKGPDNVVVTAFHTLQRMGYKGLKKLERQDYYKFDYSGDKKQFENKISQVDLLINVNKHKFSFRLENNNKGKINILVQNFSNDSGLSSVLKERLGFKNIKKLEKGVLWTMYLYGNTDAKRIAEDITKNLLMNENYQKYKIMR